MEIRPVEILLVEDNPYDLELALHALKRNKLLNSVFSARDGQEALDFVFGTDSNQEQVNLPQIVLLDLKLPKVGGLEVLRRLKSDERTRFIPVIVLTSSREERDIAESYALGANSYIVKPVDFEQFSEAIRSIGQYWLRLNQQPQR